MLNRKSGKTILLAVLVIFGFALFNFTALSLKDYRVGDLGLGIATTTKSERIDTMPLNQIEGEYDLVIPVIRSLQENHKQVCVLLGNSQLHAINYQKEGDHLAVYYLNELAEQHALDFRAVQLSSPNINFQEMLLYYLTLKEMGIKPSWVIVGCTYRTFQLTSLREKFKEQLRSLSPYMDDIELNAEVKQFYKDQSDLVKIDNAPSEQGTLQEKTEGYITEQLEKNWEAYRYRGNVRSQIKVLPGMVYRSILSEKNLYEGSETTEKLNMLFLQQLVDLCKKDNVGVLLYQPPHPQSDQSFQYNKVRYDACFKRIQSMEDSVHRIYFESFENRVPLDFWGKSNSGRLDVFHFKDEGHQILGKSIFDFLQKQSHNK